MHALMPGFTRKARVLLGLPATRPDACDPCRAGRHDLCAETEQAALPSAGQPSLCPCYDATWEAHDLVASTGYDSSDPAP